MRYRKKGMAIALLLTATLAGCNMGASSSNQKGEKAFQKEQYSEAIEYFNQAISQDNTKEEYFINQGMTYIKLGQLEKAVESFQVALEKDGANMLALRGLGIAYLKMGQYEDAIAAFDNAIANTGTRVDELDYDILQYKGEAQYGMSDYDGAIITYGKLIDLGIDTIENYIRRGILYGYQKQYDSAISDFESAINEDKSNHETYIQVYNELTKLGKEDIANEYLKKALNIEGNSDNDHLMRGKIYYMLNDMENAKTEIQSASNSGNKEAKYYLARIYEEMEDYNSAMSLYQEELANGTDEPAIIYNQIAICKMKQEDYSGALSMIEQGLKEASITLEQTKKLKWNEAMVYEQMGDYQTAYNKIKEYGDTYSYTEEVEKELAFLKTR